MNSMDRRDALGTITHHVATVVADMPQPKPERRRYPSDVKTPAVATRLPQEKCEALASIVAATGYTTAHVARLILTDWLNKHQADGAEEIRRFVTSST